MLNSIVFQDFHLHGPFSSKQIVFFLSNGYVYAIEGLPTLLLFQCQGIMCKIWYFYWVLKNRVLQISLNFHFQNKIGYSKIPPSSFFCTNRDAKKPFKHINTPQQNTLLLHVVTKCLGVWPSWEWPTKTSNKLPHFAHNCHISIL